MQSFLAGYRRRETKANAIRLLAVRVRFGTGLEFSRLQTELDFGVGCRYELDIWFSFLRHLAGLAITTLSPAFCV